jgi:hypothetical protein
VFEDIQWLGVLRSLLGVHAFRRSTSDAVTGDAVVRFLLADDRFPRSIAFCLDDVDTSLQHLPKNLAVLEACREARVLLGRAEARSWRAEDLRNLADDVQLALARVDSALVGTYFEDDEPPAVPADEALVSSAVGATSQAQSQASSPARSANGRPGSRASFGPARARRREHAGSTTGASWTTTSRSPSSGVTASTSSRSTVPRS